MLVLRSQVGRKRKIDNPGHNILELYNVLVKNIRVALQATEPLETKLLKKWKYIRKISNLGRNSLVSNFSSKNNTMVIPFKIYAKADLKMF